MHPVLLRVSLVTLLAPVLFSSGAAFAAKAKFERTKPHVNVGTIGRQGVSILVTNLRGNGDSLTPCAFSGELLATDHTPDRLVREEVLRVSVALAEGESLSIPIPYPFDVSPDGLRREVSVEINPDETSERRCSIATAVVGYDSDSQGTQYASHHRVTKIDRFVDKQPIAPASFVGFAGGNAHQVARVVFTRFDATEEELSQGRQCEYSGALLVQGVPILDSDPNEAASRAYPVKFTGPGFKSVDVRFAELGATDDTRVDLVLSYVVDSGPLAQCANWLDIGVQVVDPDTGATRSNQNTRIPAHTPEWSDLNAGDPG
jgi:hypothetical protein